MSSDDADVVAFARSRDEIQPLAWNKPEAMTIAQYIQGKILTEITFMLTSSTTWNFP